MNLSYFYFPVVNKKYILSVILYILMINNNLDTQYILLGVINACKYIYLYNGQIQY